MERVEPLSSHRLLHPPHQPLHLSGIGIAGRVAEADLHSARLDRCFGETNDIVLVDRPFDRAAESGCKAHFEMRPRFGGLLRNQSRDGAEFHRPSPRDPCGRS
jgi:hypothetical protein